MLKTVYRRVLVVFFVLSSLSGSLFAREIAHNFQESSMGAIAESKIANTQTPSPVLPKAKALFLVSKITYFIDGQTQTWALENRYHLKDKTRFISEQQLKTYFTEKEKVIASNKVFSHVRLSYSLQEEPQAKLEGIQTVDDHTVDTSTPIYSVHLFVQLQSCISCILFPPLPRVINDNLTLSFRFTEKNLGGSLLSLQLNADFAFDLGRLTHTILPRSCMGITLSDIYLPRINLGWTLDASYSYITQIVNDPKTSEKVLEYDYHRLILGLSSAVPLAPHFSYSFGISNSLLFANRFYLDKLNKQECIRQELGIPKWGSGYSLTYMHAFTYSTVQDSIKKMRRGFSVWLANSLGYNFNTFHTNADLSWGSTFYQPFANDFIELSLRYTGFWNITGTRYGINLIRGVRSQNVYGFLGNYLNTTFLFTFWRWSGVWEAQLGLFLDGGITQRLEETNNKSRNAEPLSFENFDIGLGVEGRLHLDILKSFVIYGRLGVDLKRLPYTKKQILHFWGGKYDFTIGFSTHY